METNIILQIAIPTPLRKRFDYLPNENSSIAQLKLGARVSVPFGRRNVVGVIVGITNTSDFPIEKLKKIEAILDDEPLIDEALLSLYQWTSDYYQHPIGDVILGSLPKKLREGSGSASVSNNANGSASASDHESPINFTLTAEQQTAINTILATQHFHPFLLAGITGSGKTEVYLRVISQILEKNLQALVLVPEIALTPQTVSRFQARFSVPVLLLHSGLTPVQRLTAWSNATDHSPCIVIGTRSAVFAPLKKLGVIIIDEEHDLSFKQQSGFRYSARDVAIMRAKLLDIPIVLGTATPALETWKNAQNKKYHLLQLSQRAGNAVLPKIILHDIRTQKLQNGLSAELIKTMRRHLNEGNQIIVFLNRRGYAPILLCHHCGFSVQCTHCDARLTVHDRPKRLSCHHCGYTQSIPSVCPECKQAELISLGLGTEQLETTFAQLFPDKKIARMDRDAVTTVKALKNLLTQVHNREVDILIGTQMLIKGHHFENVTLVAAIDVDHALFSSDFRSVERLGQSLIQVAGRAGRMEKIGEVFIQTHHPDHPLIKKLFDENYSAFADAVLTERSQTQLPPFSHMVLLRAEGKNRERVNTFLLSVKKTISSSIESAGPFPLAMAKKAGIYRAQLILQSPQRSLLKNTLMNLLQSLEKEKKLNGVRWLLDVDPMEMG